MSALGSPWWPLILCSEETNVHSAIKVIIRAGASGLVTPYNLAKRGISMVLRRAENIRTSKFYGDLARQDEDVRGKLWISRSLKLQA